MSEEHRCLVVDSHPTMRMGVRDLLSDRFDVEEVDDGHAALEALTADDFDVVIVDIHPDGPPTRLRGTAAIKELRRARPGVPIVAHGRRAERHAAAQAIDAGASAYVIKSSPPEALFAAVNAATDEECFVDPAAGSSRHRAITRRQREILQLIADGRSTARAAKTLGLSAETVRTHTKALLSRLGARDRAHAVAIALRHGLIE